MSKLLWVALPLLLSAAFVVVQAVRRRMPSRAALNVWSSVLLLIYVLTTASLGIFWVANQQLPVFDWHYLFGYGTVLLLSFHLALNFRVVWRHLSRRRPEPYTQDRPASGRRGALGAIGMLLLTGAAFVLGLRHGRSELRVSASPASGSVPVSDAGAVALSVVERFHAFSSHSRAGVMAKAPGADWGEPPPPFKRYPGAPRTPLPAAHATRPSTLDLAALGTVLWHTCGVTLARGGLQLRASPSSGALFSTELYVVALDLPGLARGVWHYDAAAHAMERVGEWAMGAAVAETDVADAPALIVATAVFRRTGQKYRDRTYRYVLADLGHALENLRASATAVNAQGRFIAGFDETRLADAMGIDEDEEGLLAVVAWQAVQRTGAASSTALGRPMRWRSPSLAADERPLGVTAAVHAATSLHAIEPVTPALAAPIKPVVLPRVEPAPSDVLAIIERRRSVRRFSGRPLAVSDLAAVLKHMTGVVAMLSSAVRIDVVVHAVEGMAPGVYRYETPGHVLLPRRMAADLRRAARAAALDQDVIGDAAAVFVLSIDRAGFAADPLGPARGYRHAFLEAGLIGERIYLEAGARGLGACAVGAFYDDEASALVSVDPAHEWVVHFAALGIPSG